MARIQYTQAILEKESQKKMAELEDVAHLARQKARADADLYTAQKAAEANKVL